MNDTLEPRGFAAEIEDAARADGWTVRHLSPTASGPRPWFQRRAARPDAPALYFSSGIHGDEISGPLALLELVRRPEFFAEFDVTMFPILNPDGLAQGIRYNGDGIDLNRDYRNPKSAEIAGHLEALRTLGRFAATMVLHEDYEGIGAYLYELNENLCPTLGRDIITAMGRHVPIDLRPEIEEVRAIGGIIQRSDLVRKHGPVEEREEWPEGIYLMQHHSRVSFTTETPKPFPLAARVAAQVAAVETLAAAVRTAPRSC
jgi:hypothetical protein